MRESPYRAIPMAESWRSVLSELEAKSRWRETEVGPLIYALVRAMQPEQMMVLTSAPELFLWAALGAVDEAADPSELLRRGNGSGRVRWLSSAEEVESVPEDVTADCVLLDATSGPVALSETVSARLAPRALVLVLGAENAASALGSWGADPRSLHTRILETPSLFTAARTERPVRYEQSDKERFIAVLLAAMQPDTLALGPNVVFDGAIKPRPTRINFSGTGGQIGARDLLLTHPEDLQRFTPLPGAVALVLGELEASIQTPHVRLDFGDEAGTLVVG